MFAPVTMATVPWGKGRERREVVGDKDGNNIQKRYCLTMDNQ